MLRHRLNPCAKIGHAIQQMRTDHDIMTRHLHSRPGVLHERNPSCRKIRCGFFLFGSHRRRGFDRRHPTTLFGKAYCPHSRSRTDIKHTQSGPTPDQSLEKRTGQSPRRFASGRRSGKISRTLPPTIAAFRRRTTVTPSTALRYLCMPQRQYIGIFGRPHDFPRQARGWSGCPWTVRMAGTWNRLCSR